jgi:hypothetical protein
MEVAIIDFSFSFEEEGACVRRQVEVGFTTQPKEERTWNEN